MKKICLSLALVFTAAFLFAQSPNAFNYQAVLRDADGQIRMNQNITLDLAILQGDPTGTVVYSETHNATTSQAGLINLAIGTGNTTGDFSGLDWSAGPYFLQVTVDGVPLSATQLLSVPYALYANQAGNTFSGDYNDLTNKPSFTESDPVYSAAPASGITDAGSGLVITAEERNKLNEALSVTGAVQQGNLLTFDGNNWIARDLVTGLTGANQAINNMQPYTVINYIIALEGVYPSRNGPEPFIGEISMFGGNFAPRGWALCDGQLLSIAQFTALFSLIGTIYGGDGRTTFALPDLRGRAPIHAGNGPGLTPRRLGERSGSETIILSPSQLPAHNHTVNGNN